MTQLSLKAGLKEWGDKDFTASQSEMKQFQKQTVLESHMFLKKKREGKIKGRTVAGGNKQCDYISKEYASSSTVAT
jgi:hypothetical protein